MDGLNKAYSQLVELWRGTSAKVRFTAIVLFVVAALGMTLLGRYELTGQTTYLLGGQTFSADEITAVQGARQGPAQRF